MTRCNTILLAKVLEHLARPDTELTDDEIAVIVGHLAEIEALFKIKDPETTPYVYGVV